jgi:hypothetical protein
VPKDVVEVLWAEASLGHPYTGVRGEVQVHLPVSFQGALVNAKR